MILTIVINVKEINTSKLKLNLKVKLSTEGCIQSYSYLIFTSIMLPHVFRVYQKTWYSSWPIFTMEALYIELTNACWCIGTTQRRQHIPFTSKSCITIQGTPSNLKCRASLSMKISKKMNDLIFGIHLEGAFFSSN